jgi:acetyl-CoA acyltransferase
VPEPVIVGAQRTPIGKRGGALAGWHPVDLAAEVINGTVAQAGAEPSLVQDVILGCTTQAGDQALNIARNAVLAAGFPDSVPGVTINRACGSGQQAVEFAAYGISGGAYDLVIAGGVEHMTRVPLDAARTVNGNPYSERLLSRYSMVHQAVSAQLIAERYGLTREELDNYSFRSHQNARRAVREGRFSREILPLKIEADSGQLGLLDRDQGIRFDTSLEKLAALKSAFEENGVLTAGNSSQISDGAAAVLLASEEQAEKLGLRPRARFVAHALVGVDPIVMLTGPIPATRAVLERSGLTLEDMDVVEVNEAFASVPLAWIADLDADLERLNPNGGAISLGHPVGASGARLFVTALHELERTGGRYALVTMCEGDGMANATIIERL